MTPEQIIALREKYNIQPIGTSTPTTQTTATGTTDRVAMAKELVAMRKKQPLKSAQPKEGFISKVGSDLERRAGQLRETYEQTATGEINPAETGIRTIGSLIGGISDVAFRAAGGILKGLTPDVIEKPVVEAGKKLISKAVSNPIVNETITTLQRLAEENPRAAKDISALIDIATVLPVGAGAKATKPIVSAAEKAVAKTAQKSSSILKYGITQATGLGRETVETIIKNPEAFSKKIAETLNRESLGAQVKNAINKRLAAQSTLGTEYNAIRKMTDKVVNLGGTLKESSLKKFGLQMKDGVIKMTAESKPFSTSELKTIENFIETYGRSNLSPNAVLNAREALSNIAKFESGKTGTLINWAKDVRANLNKVAQKQLPKLKQLDDAYSAEARVLKQIKKDYFKQGSTDFKDNALGRLANLTKEGRQPILNRLKEFVPDIEKKVNILRAIEDIKAAGGIKVGTYVKGGLALGGAMSGNIPLLLGAIFAQPEVIVPILRAWGKFRLAQKGLVEVIIKKLETGVKLAKDEERFVSQAIGNWGERVIKATEKIKPGLTLEDVSKKGKGEILKSTPLKTGDYLYHGTNEDVLDNIIKEGLKPGMRGQLSLSKTEDYAKSFARDGITPKGKTSGIMLRIKTDALNGKTTLKRADGKTRPMSDQLNEILTKETVSPESLEILKNGKWIPLTDYKKLPLKSTPLVSKTDDLVKEAKKYKSAEEFVKAQQKQADLLKQRFQETKSGSDLRAWKKIQNEIDSYEVDVAKKIEIKRIQEQQIKDNKIRQADTTVDKLNKDDLDLLTNEAKKYNNLDDFIGKIRGSATQYGEYTPKLRKYVRPESVFMGDIKGLNPNTKITIYRGIDSKSVAGKHIRGGDFVTTDYNDALQYTDSPGKVVSLQTRLKNLVAEYPDEVDISNPLKPVSYELLYNPTGKINKITKSKLTEIWQQAQKLK